jgi:hypothetical protein
MFNFSSLYAVIPAGIAGIQKPRMAIYTHIPVIWIPAIHAGMTSCHAGMTSCLYANA